MKHILMKSLPVVGLMIWASNVAAADLPLGSPAESVGRFSTNYAEAVRAALPRVDAAALATLMDGVREAAAGEKPLAITSVRGVEKFFAFRERGQGDSTDFVDVGVAVYKFDPAKARIYVAWRHPGAQAVARKAFSTRMPAIREVHEALAGRLGIPTQEIMFTDFREILSETDGHPIRRKGVRGPILSEGALTTMLRAVGGVLVEGSYLRVSSLDAERLDLVDVRWPMVRLSDSASRGRLRSPEDVLEAIVKRVETNEHRQAVNVRMAVVLRPIDWAKPTEFVPSLKIGIEPKSVKTDRGYRTDAGEVFYSDLLRDSPPFVEPTRRDSTESGGS